MAEILWNNQAHIPGRVALQVWRSPTSRFNMSSLGFVIDRSFDNPKNQSLPELFVSLEMDIFRPQTVQGHGPVIDLNLPVASANEEIL